MKRLQILVDGETILDQEVNDDVVPTKPEAQAALANTDPTLMPPPWQQIMILALLGRVVMDKVLADPRLGTLDSKIETRPTGWTISVDRL